MEGGEVVVGDEGGVGVGEGDSVVEGGRGRWEGRVGGDLGVGGGGEKDGLEGVEGFGGWGVEGGGWWRWWRGG